MLDLPVTTFTDNMTSRTASGIENINSVVDKTKTHGKFALSSLDKITETIISKIHYIGIKKALLCVFLPPLAILDKGRGAILLVSVLTLCGWVPGVTAALVVCTKANK